MNERQRGTHTPAHTRTTVAVWWMLFLMANDHGHPSFATHPRSEVEERITMRNNEERRKARSNKGGQRSKRNDQKKKIKTVSILIVIQVLFLSTTSHSQKQHKKRHTGTGILPSLSLSLFLVFFLCLSSFGSYMQYIPLSDLINSHLHNNPSGLYIGPNGHPSSLPACPTLYFAQSMASSLSIVFPHRIASRFRLGYRFSLEFFDGAEGKQKTLSSWTVLSEPSKQKILLQLNPAPSPFLPSLVPSLLGVILS